MTPFRRMPQGPLQRRVVGIFDSRFHSSNEFPPIVISGAFKDRFDFAQDHEQLFSLLTH